MAELRDGATLTLTGSSPEASSDDALLAACSTSARKRGQRLARSITAGHAGALDSSAAAADTGPNTEEDLQACPAQQETRGGAAPSEEGRGRAYGRAPQFLSHNGRRAGSNRGGLWLERSLLHISDVLRSTTPTRQLSQDL
jgi:hypothetical protein